MPAKIISIAFVRGIGGTLDSQVVVTNDSTNRDHLLKDMIEDEDGLRITEFLDDVMESVSITIQVQASYVLPQIGSIIAYKGSNYILDSIAETRVNKGYAQYVFAMHNTENNALTLP